MERIQSDGDDYWFLFSSLRARLKDLYQYRRSLGDRWDKIPFEGFAFKFRMFLEEYSLFIRAALIERGQLSRKELKAYGPKTILGGLEDEIAELRFITARSLRKEVHSDEEFSLPFEYGNFVYPNVREMEALYGQLGNFAHPSLITEREPLAKSITAECFEFFKNHQAIFRRHALEKFGDTSGAPPTDLTGMLFIVGTTDDGDDIFIRCEGNTWIDRSPNRRRMMC